MVQGHKIIQLDYSDQLSQICLEIKGTFWTDLVTLNLGTINPDQNFAITM